MPGLKVLQVSTRKSTSNTRGYESVGYGLGVSEKIVLLLTNRFDSAIFANSSTKYYRFTEEIHAH